LIGVIDTHFNNYSDQMHLIQSERNMFEDDESIWEIDLEKSDVVIEPEVASDVKKTSRPKVKAWVIIVVVFVVIIVSGIGLNFIYNSIYNSPQFVIVDTEATYHSPSWRCTYTIANNAEEGGFVTVTCTFTDSAGTVTWSETNYIPADFTTTFGRQIIIGGDPTGEVDFSCEITGQGDIPVPPHQSK
jgi:hypothetical protein